MQTTSRFQLNKGTDAPGRWICRCCDTVKLLSEFQKDASRKNGHAGKCRDCANKQRAEWTERNPNKQRAHVRKWMSKNSDKVRAYQRRWLSERPGYEKAKTARWRKADPKRNALLQANRLAIKLRATPSWANEFFISEIYDLAGLRTRLLGIKHTVDHVVPLQSKRVCGLHCEANLRVITSSQNSTKGNRVWPDMP